HPNQEASDPRICASWTAAGATTVLPFRICVNRPRLSGRYFRMCRLFWICRRRRKASMGRPLPYPLDARRVPRPRLRSLLGLAFLLGTVLLPSGCITTGPVDWVRNGFKVGPNYCRPPAPVAETWIEANNPNIQNRFVENWWQVFGDGTLNSLINTAYA